MKIPVLVLLVQLAFCASWLHAEEIQLSDPIGLYVESYDDTIGQAMSELVYMYLNARGYYPVNLNEVWEGRTKLHDRRKLRKRAESDGINSLIVMEVNPADKKRGWIFSNVKDHFFRMKAKADFYENAGDKRPTYERAYSEEVFTKTEFDFGKYELSFVNISEPAMRMVTSSVDQIFRDLPARADTSHSAFVSIPTTIACDRKFRSYYGEEEWVREMAKAVVMANRVLSRDLGIVLHVEASMVYDDIPKEVESLQDLASHLVTESFRIPEGIMVFFSSKNLEPRWGEMTGELGLAPILGKRVVVGLQVAEHDSISEESEMWDYLYEGMIVAHEIGHMLGAVHTDDHKSIMYPIANIVYPRFDKANQERIRRFLPLFLTGNSFLDSCSYPTLMSELTTIYPDSMDMVHALRGLLYDHGYGVSFVKRCPELAKDLVYDLASGVQMLHMGMNQVARSQFIQAIDRGYESPSLMLEVAFLYYEDDSLRAACEYLDLARENGVPFPELPECSEDSLKAVGK